MNKKPLNLINSNKLHLAMGISEERAGELGEITYQIFRKCDATSEMLNHLYVQLNDAAEILYSAFHLASCITKIEKKTNVAALASLLKKIERKEDE